MKYFSKGFLKLALGFLFIVVLSLLLITALSIYAAGVEKIAFITNEQAIKPNELSLALTIQTQDISNNVLQTSETIDLEFISSSLTGEFLSSSGNPVSTTMSKGTANRTFYYRDSSEGSFTITVKAKGRDSSTEWSASQQISVSLSASTALISTSTPSISSGSTTSGPSIAISSSANSASQLEVSAGADRLTSPGSPIMFQAVIKKNNASNSGPFFSWSFGDGNVGEGSLVTHVYKYPGDYILVLNARTGSTYATSRLKVKVIEPTMSVRVGDGYIEIVNNTNNEVNLFNWKITKGNKSFIFQPDTIVLGNSSIKIPNSMLAMKSSENPGVILKNFMGDTVASASLPQAPRLETIALTEIMPENYYATQNNIRTKELASREAKAPEVLGESTTTEVADKPQDNIIYQSPPNTHLWSRAWQFLVSMLD